MYLFRCDNCHDETEFSDAFEMPEPVNCDDCGTSGCVCCIDDGQCIDCFDALDLDKQPESE